MDLTCEERFADSPFVQRVWRSENAPGDFISVASPNWEMVISRYRGTMSITIRGPETTATPAFCPPDAEFFGIQFQPGVFMPMFPAGMLIDRRDVTLPLAGSRSFWLNGAAWQFPTFDNVEAFIRRLAHEDLLVNDTLVRSVLRGELPDTSPRSVQRRFLRATGMTHTMRYQIERARYAAALLKQGDPILDVVAQAGYSDQPHLTRLLRRFIGQTPAQLNSAARSTRLSFLFNTTASVPDMLVP